MNDYDRLKIKALSLGAEARIIHEHERRLKRRRDKMLGKWRGRWPHRVELSREVNELCDVPKNFAEQIAACERRAARYAELSEDEKDRRECDFNFGFGILHEHRVNLLRRETRSTHLARAFMKGMPYPRVEYSCREKPNWDAIEKLVQRYSVREETDPPHLERQIKQQFAEWISSYPGTIDERKKNGDTSLG